MGSRAISGAGGRVTTFLMGDLVGSTAHWLSSPEKMEEALRVHDGLVDAAVSKVGGDRFKHTGDGFLAQFDDPDSAVDAARQIRVGLDGVDPVLGPFLEFRLAIDTGWATSRDGDWFGPTVNRVARITDLVSSSGFVMTSASAEMMRRTDTGHDLGEVSLRSHHSPIRLVGVDGAGLAVTSARRSHSRLPRARSAFVGRATELDHLRTLVEGHRLVTVVATGGAGKTRLAIEIAAEFSDAGFVDLVPCQDVLEVARRVAEGAGVDVDGLSSSAVLEAIRAHTAGHIGARETLLVLDNCEHVLAAARTEVDELLDRCPGLRILATSRERLGAAGEHVWQLPSLDVGAALFHQRAEAHGIDLGDSDEVQAAVIQICARLDGLPLAIELAAARLTEVGLGDLVRDLDTLMVTHVADEVDGLGRHRTMSDVVAWSYEALDDSSRCLFERVALLEGSFRTADVGLLGPVDPSALAVLVRRSLLVQERDGLDLQFRMLEPVRQVARSLLIAGGSHDTAMADLLDGLGSACATEYGGGYWDWATLDDLRPLLSTMWRVVEWLEAQGRDREVLAFVAQFAGVAIVFADARRVTEMMSARTDHLDEFTPEEQAGILVSYSLAGIGAMQIDHTTAGVVALFGLGLGECAPMAFANRSAALGAMHQAFRDGTDSPFALEMLESARAAAAVSGSAYERAAVEAFEGWALLLAGRWSDALAASDVGVHHVAAGNVWHLVVTANKGMALIRLDRCDEALALARDHPDRGRYTYWGDMLGYVEVLALAQLGRHDEADRTLLTLIDRVLGSIHPGHRGDLILVAAWVAVAQRRLPDARRLMAQPVTTRGPHSLQLLRGLGEATGTAPTRGQLEDNDADEVRLTPVLEAERKRLRAATDPSVGSSQDRTDA